MDPILRVSIGFGAGIPWLLNPYKWSGAPSALVAQGFGFLKTSTRQSELMDELLRLQGQRN